MIEQGSDGGDTPRAALHLLIEGRVQGVGFRAFVRARAQALGVVGWVCNRPDGAVEVAAAGTPEAVGDLRRAILTGPPRAVVSAVRELPLVPLDGSDQFAVVRPVPVQAENPVKRWWKFT